MKGYYHFLQYCIHDQWSWNVVFIITFQPLWPCPCGNTPEMFLRFFQQVALGMQYLSAKGFVHRDLAARNRMCLFQVKTYARFECKLTSIICYTLLINHWWSTLFFMIIQIADFGRSRDLADDNYYISWGQDKIPVKWTAHEAIHYKKYSTASDVWAYGCLLYEIWSVGHKPFEGMKNVTVSTMSCIPLRFNRTSCKLVCTFRYSNHSWVQILISC